jgi:2-(1,2-epoxy-1,2-dihydrophenyl)acetyl-CoA isomerase
MEYKEILLEKEGGVAILTLNRPEKLNALSLSMRAEIHAAMQQVQEDDDIRALIITGAGRGFCSGADVAIQAARIAGQLEETSRKTILEMVGSVILAFEKVNKPVIGAINGVAAGVGLSLALACDIRIASEEARFSAIWVRRGLIPDGGGTYLLPMLVGVDKALELSFSGEMINAAEAERIRLVTRIVPHDQLMIRAKELAHQIASGPPIAMELMKKMVWEEIRNNIRKHLIFESYGQNICRKSEDHKEGSQAAKEKRPPNFKGL